MGLRGVVSQYILCPRRYRYRYRDGWEEKQTRAGMIFGQVFEKALAACFCRQNSAAVLEREWGAARTPNLDYGADSAKEMLRQGWVLLERFCREGRVVGFVDAVGELDNERSLLEWKVTSRCYARKPGNLAQLDPQLVCYSWLTGIERAALVVFVRRRFPEIQYLRATITTAERENFAAVVAETTRQIERAHFPQHPGIRFPQDRCVSCPLSGLCLHEEGLVKLHLQRDREAELGWLDELAG